LHLTRESLLGFVFLASGAGAVIVGSKITQEANDLAAILFGSAVVVQHSDLVLIAIATVVLLGGHLVLWRALLFAGYDPMGARVQGMPVRQLNVFLFLSVGLSVALCTRALGALPVFAFSVLPAMTALALTSRIGLVFVLATVIGALSGVGGYVVSFKGDLPVGATQTAAAAALLTAALVYRFARTRYERRARTTPAPRTEAADTRARSAGPAPSSRSPARPRARRRDCAARSTISAAATERLRLRVMPGIGIPNTASAAPAAAAVRPSCSLPIMTAAGRAKSRSSTVAAAPGIAA